MQRSRYYGIISIDTNSIIILSPVFIYKANTKEYILTVEIYN